MLNEFLLNALSFHKKWKNEIHFSFFIFMKELKNQLLKMINFMVIFTSIFYTLFKSKFVSSPLRFLAIQWSGRHQEFVV